MQDHRRSTQSPRPARRLGAVALAALVLTPALCGVARAAPAGYSSPSRFVEGEVLVHYRSDAAALQAKAMLGTHGMRLKRALDSGQTVLLELPAITRVADAIAVLRDDPDVAYAEPNFLKRRRAVIPDDPLFDLLWGLRSTGQANFVPDAPEYASIPGADMHMITAWDADDDGVADRTGDGSVTVAVIDDAFDLTHPDYAANLVAGRDLSGDDNDPSPDNDGLQEHGTLVVGSLGAIGNNGIGVAGTIWNVAIMPLKVSRIRDAQVELDTASIIAAYNYARTHGAQIVNASFGGPDYSQAEFDAIQAMAAADILLVTSAGNFQSNLDDAVAAYPANYELPNVVAVAATNRQDNIASFSQFGPISTDVAAPGLQIVTTTVGGGYNPPTNCGEDGGTCGANGTSFAAPYTAGVAALIRNYHPNADMLETRARLIEGADPGVSGGDAGELSAGGRVNARDSLDLDPRPAIRIRSVALEDGGNARLDPGETLDIAVTLENLWMTATGVEATLAAGAGSVSIATATQAAGTLSRGGSATLRFPVTVLAQSAPYRQVTFTLHISANGGAYTATRHFIEEIAPLQADTPVSAQLSTGLHDEFHTYHFDFPGLPAGTSRLVFRSSANADIDLLVKRGEPAQYDIDLGADPADDPIFYTNADKIGGGDDGDEAVVFSCPQATDTYYVTVVNYSLNENLDYSLEASTESSSADPCSPNHSSGGGALAPWASLWLALAAALRTRRRQRLRP
ncbi:MAG: S8 family serine peptidase [Nevskiales bacterium]|nr:S8 family serine peptidase [Nevskiales bacterium]